ncbi:hypothetical protein CSPX01_17332 [Colletotrichum filicis]|nr:hypothetical protein CSPX01_17332 [Colletotrichum filicis]
MQQATNLQPGLRQAQVLVHVHGPRRCPSHPQNLLTLQIHTRFTRHLPKQVEFQLAQAGRGLLLQTFPRPPEMPLHPNGCHLILPCFQPM